MKYPPGYKPWRDGKIGMNQYKCNICNNIEYDPREPDDLAWDFIVQKCPKCNKGKMVFVKAV